MNLQSKKFVYHRALNSEVAFKEFVALSKASKYALAAEGDLCWTYIDGVCIIYLHHPDAQGKALSNAKVKQLFESDELFTLEKLFAINSEVNFILELKTGDGTIEDFCVAFEKTLQRYGAKNVLVDAFSVEQLRALKKQIPTIKTSLHTKFVFSKYVLESTFEKPYVRIHNLYNLPFIDYVTISYTTTHVNVCNLDIDKSYKHILSSGKKLNLGSIKSLNAFEKLMNSQVEYAYLRSNDVKNNYENILEGNLYAK